MTTLVVVRKNNEVAIAADSLTTFGDTRLTAKFDRIYDKIVRYRDSYVGLCGSAAHQLVFESLLAQLGERLDVLELLERHGRRRRARRRRGSAGSRCSGTGCR
mgnify:CR=1 FL=1